MSSAHTPVNSRRRCCARSWMRSFPRSRDRVDCSIPNSRRWSDDPADATPISAENRHRHGKRIAISDTGNHRVLLGRLEGDSRMVVEPSLPPWSPPTFARAGRTARSIPRRVSHLRRRVVRRRRRESQRSRCRSSDGSSLYNCWNRQSAQDHGRLRCRSTVVSVGPRARTAEFSTSRWRVCIRYGLWI